MSGELETVATFNDPSEAKRAQNRLRNAGIHAVLVGVDAVTAAGDSADGIALQVPAGDVMEARICLDDLGPEDDHAEQITATPHAFSRPPQRLDLEENEEPPPNPRERNAERAFIGAAFGIVFIPIQFYAFYLLLQVFVSNDELRPRYRRRAWFAVAFNLPWLLLFCLMLRRM